MSDQESPALPPQFALAGRLFEPVLESTFRHDLHLSALIERAGLGGLAEQAQAGAAFAPLAMASLGELYRRGVVFELLGAVVTEVGQPWTPAQAQKNADAFADLTDPADKALLAKVLMETLAGFFASGVGSGVTSDPSSPPTAVGPASSSPSAAPTPGSAASPGSGLGMPSSAPSPATIPSAAP